jgi:hypothetical protein
MRYIIVKADTRAQLIALVNDEIRRGYIPIGGVVVSVRSSMGDKEYLQAALKQTEGGWK